jgi:hypothetical protein
LGPKFWTAENDDGGGGAGGAGGAPGTGVELLNRGTVANCVADVDAEADIGRDCPPAPAIRELAE